MRSRRRNWKILISLVTIIAMLSAMTVMVSAGSTRSDPSNSGPVDILLTKKANVSQIPVDGTITYTITISNESNATWATAYISSLTDSLPGIDLSDVTWNPSNTPTVGINPDASATGTYTFFVSDALYNPGQYVNNSVTVGFYSLKNDDVDSAKHVFSVTTSADPVLVTGLTPPTPTVTLDKIADRTAFVAGADDGVVDYDVVITNTSAFPVLITAFTDSLNPTFLSPVGQELAAGAALTVEYSMIFPDPGSYPNTASVTVRQANTEATSPPTATATDTVTVVVSTPNTDPDAPTVTLNKIADRTALVAGADDGVVNYDVVITNTSDFPVVITAISDTQYPAIGTHVDHVLAAGGVLTVEYPLTYTVPATYPNTASVTVERAIDDGEMYATSENPLSATASDTETVIVTAAPPPPVVSTGSSSTKYVTPPAEEIVVAGAVMPEPEPEVVVMGAEMPKTGDNSNNLFAILGFVVLVAGGILILTLAKRQKSS